MNQCLNPLIAVKSFVNSEGKQVLRFYGKNNVDYNLKNLRQKYGDENVYIMGCGTCESCRKNYSQDWALRVSLECSCHQYNYFVTLTYRDEALQFFSKKDFRKFIDRLEGHSSQNKVKYFACCERGDLTQRQHWHVVLMLDKPLDLNHPVKIGNYYHYHSKDLDKLWKFGLHDISPVLNCAAGAYVAKYTGKDSHVYMSRNLGKHYFYDHMEEIKKDNFKLYLNYFNNGQATDVPKCFKEWFKCYDPLGIESYLDEKCMIGRTFSHIQQRLYCSEHEEVMLANKISCEKDKKIKRRSFNG